MFTAGAFIQSTVFTRGGTSFSEAGRQLSNRDGSTTRPCSGSTLLVDLACRHCLGPMHSVLSSEERVISPEKVGFCISSERPEALGQGPRRRYHRFSSRWDDLPRLMNGLV
ncbi:hypothetical protein MRX96_051148 [Rhipicephalus microplus]